LVLKLGQKQEQKSILAHLPLGTVGHLYIIRGPSLMDSALA
jgi:hypothetical protein